MAARTQWLIAFLVITGIIAATTLLITPRPPSLAELFPSGQIRVGVDPSYAPFAFYIGDDIQGLDIDLAWAIGNDLGIPVRLVALGFDGLYDALITDQVDVLISALPIEVSRLDRVIYTNPYFNAGLVLVSPHDSPILSMRDLAGLRLAYEYGSTAHTEVNRWLRRIRPFVSQPYELESYALDAVRLGDADAALVDAISAGLYARDHAEWTIQQAQVTDLLYAAAVRADYPARVTVLNESIKRLFERGELQQIIARWL